MTEKIIIEKFAGIEFLDITLEEINIMIGPQASGKSICAKVLYFFKSIFPNLALSIEQNYGKREFDNRILSKFNEYFPQKYIGPGNFSLSYIYNDNFITLNQTSGKRKISYSENLLKQLPFLRTEYKKLYEKMKDDEGIERYRLIWDLQKKYFDNLEKTVGQKAALSQLFIPAGRSFFALLQSNIFSFLSSNRTLDPFLIEFGSFYEAVKDWQLFSRNEDIKKDKKILDEIAKYQKEIIHGMYSQERGDDFIITDDGRKVGLANTSSGQQESLPLALILGMLPITSLRRLFNTGYGLTIYIEEPEAHIFPDAQKKIVELISYVYNNSKSKFQFVITTHSPYVLTSINNLIFAGSLGCTENIKVRRKVNSLIPENIWLKTENVGAYSLHDGKSECIKSKESGLINSEYIDYVSNIIGGVFEELIELS